MKIRVLLTGRGYQIAQHVPDPLEVPDGCRVTEAIALVAQRLPADQALPDSCLVAVQGKHLGSVRSHDEATLQEGDELMLIAPVAGG